MNDEHLAIPYHTQDDLPTGDPPSAPDAKAEKERQIPPSPATDGKDSSADGSDSSAIGSGSFHDGNESSADHADTGRDGEGDSDFSPPEEETESVGERDTAAATADPDPAIFADPMPAADSDSGAAAPTDEASGLRQLRDELNRLREQLAQRESADRMSAECREFCELYPDVPLSSLPDSVWEEVKRGIPVAAAYAVAQRRSFLLHRMAEESNQSNRVRSPGALGSKRNDYFSPEEVRTMSPEEVRANYHTIRRSMQSWH